MNLEGTSKNIINCIKPSLVIEYCYGIFRYRINGPPLSPPGKAMKVLSIIITILLVSSINYVCIVPEIVNTLHDKFNIGILIRVILWSIGSLYYAASNISLILWQNENNLKVLEIFSNIDVALHASMNNNFYKTSQNECKKMIFIYFLFIISMVTSACVYEDAINIKLISYFFMYFEGKIEIVVLCEFLYLLVYRMMLIKKYLKKFIASQNQRHNVTLHTYRNLLKKVKLEENINFVGSASVTNNKILDLANAYKDAGDACNIINKLFNIIITTTITFTFVLIISFFWAALKWKSIQDTTKTLFNIIVWSFAELFSVFIIAYYCEEVLKVKEDIKIILNKIVIDRKLPKEMRDQAKVFDEITEVWPLTVHAYNMFRINKNLMLNFIGICTSYLIVVIQVDEFVQEE